LGLGWDDYYWCLEPGTGASAGIPLDARILGLGAGIYFHEGYWGPVVGFYGGINYGFGYLGVGMKAGAGSTTIFITTAR